MFLKKQIIRKRGGVYVYYRIVSAYRDENGRVKHRIEKHLGALTDAEADRIRAALRAGEYPGPSPAAQQGAPAEGLSATALPAFAFLGMHRLVHAPGSPSEWNVTDADMILLVRGGRGELQLGWRAYALEAGAAFYWTAGTGMHVANPYDEPLLLDRISFASFAPADSMNAGAGYARLAGPYWTEGEIPAASPGRIGRLADELRSATEPGVHACEPLRVQLACCQLLASLFQPRPAAGEAPGSGWIGTAIRHVHDHYGLDVTRDRLAATIGVSPAHFSRAFRRETGLGFVDYLRRVRIWRAQELLQLAPRKQIGEIAGLCGFRSEPYFSRKFKQLTGHAPSAYRDSPKSYISLSGHITSNLLTLGIVPAAGALELWMRGHYEARGDLSGMRTIGEFEAFEPPAVRDSEGRTPDLILARPADKQELERLRRYGPVFRLPDTDDGWRESFFLLADAVNRRAEAEAWVRRFDARAAACREALAPLLARKETATILKIVSERLYVYGRTTSMSGFVLYDALGLRPPEAVMRELIDRKAPNKPIAPEELPRFAADRIFVFDYRTQWYPDGYAWMRSDAWLGLDAVRNGRVYMPDPKIFYGCDALSLEVQLEEAFRLLRS